MENASLYSIPQSPNSALASLRIVPGSSGDEIGGYVLRWQSNSSRSYADRATTYLLFIAGISVIYAFWSLFATKVVRVQPKNSASRPVWYKHSDPVLGLDVMVAAGKSLAQGRFLEWTRNVLTPYGKTLSWLCIGRQAIYTIDPENLKTMLSTNFNDFGLGKDRRNGFRPLFGNGIFNADGAVWKGHREMLHMTIRRVRSHELSVFERHIEALVTAIPKDGSTFDLRPLFAAMTLDISTDIFLGSSTHLLSPQHQEQGRTQIQDFAKAFEYAQRTLVGLGGNSAFEVLTNLLFGDQKLKLSLTIVNDFVEDILDRALQQSESKPSIAGEQQRKSTGGFLGTLIDAGRSRSEMKYDIINLIVAGRDATTEYMSSIWYMLSKHPDVHQKIYEEIAVLDGRLPTKEDLMQLTYLHMVLKEVIRLFPPVVLNQRTAEVDTILPHGGGADGQSPLLVKRGTSVGYSVYAMHRLPEFFGEDTDEFRPERWNEIDPQWAYMPFHGGPRTCLGKQFAMTLVKYCTVRLVQELPRPKDRNDQPWRESLALTCSSKHGVKVSFDDMGS